MSVKAYRVKNVEYCKSPSFSLFFEDELVNYLQDKFQFFVLLDDDGVGFAVLPVEALQSALLNVVLREEVRTALKADIAFGKNVGWVRYIFYEE